MARVRWAGIAAAALVACTSPKDCSAIGCVYADSHVVVTVASSADVDASDIALCIEGDCERPFPFADVEQVPDGSFVFVVPGAHDGDEVIVTLARPDGDLTGSATMRSSRPNGEGCAPVCTQAEVSLAAG